jgi:hypothetical protein
MEAVVLWNQFNDDQKIEVKRMIEEFVQRFAEDLMLEGLQYIIACDDFRGDVTTFQKFHGKRLGYTDNGLTVAVAKTLDYIEDGQYKVFIFLSPRLLECLFEGADNGLFWHTLHHELCHVHEGNIAFNLYGESIEKCFDDYLSKIKFAHAELIWSEYIATRLSISTTNEGNDFHINDLLKAIPVGKANCENFINDAHMSIEELFGQIQLETSHLFKLSSYVLGYIHGLKIDDQTKHEIIEELFNRNEWRYFKDFFLSLDKELQRLFLLFPNWDSVHELNNLTQTVVLLWNEMGIDPSFSGDMLTLVYL